MDDPAATRFRDMRTLSATEQALLQSGAYAVHCRVLVRDAGGILQDLSVLAGTDWVVEARWDDDIDFPVAQAEVTLWREGPEGSLSPFVGSSPLNAGGPLLDAGREIRIETAITPPGAAPAAGDWRLVFQGHIDHVSFGRRESRVTVRARDLGGTLLDTWIETQAVYGSTAGTPVETVMQQILDDTLGSGAVTLLVPSSPGFLITPYTQEQMSLLQALQQLADLIGWVVRYRWDEGSGAFRLTFYEPPRAASAPVWTFGPDAYLDVTDLAIDRAGIRNVVEISYRDAASGQRQKFTVFDANSIARYGRRWMQIVEPDSSPIDTEQEATALANAVLSDLADPKAEQEIELHYWWPVELNDFYRFLPNGVHYDGEQDLAVVSWRHEIGPQRARTFIRVRGRPAGAYRRWQPPVLPPPALPPTAEIRTVSWTAVDEVLRYEGTLGQYSKGPLQYRRRIDQNGLEGAWGPGPGDGWTPLPMPFPEETVTRHKSQAKRVVLQVRDAHLLVAHAEHIVQPELPAIDPATGLIDRGTPFNDGKYALLADDAQGTIAPPTVRQSDGVAPRVLVKGYVSGVARDGDEVLFPQNFSAPPLIILRGGISVQPDSDLWSIPSAFDPTKAQYDDVRVIVTAASFKLHAKLKQKGVATEVSDNFPSGNDLQSAGAETTAPLSNPQAAVTTYTVHYRVTITHLPTETGDTMVTLAVDSIEGGVPTERARRNYSHQGPGS
ncbi:MAG TPA: hypothetical protein VIL25_00430, partial [Vicinamibacterales bacterium]